MGKIYPDSGVELSTFVAKHYDQIMNLASFGQYKRFIKKAIADLEIKPNEHILDIGCGTGRNIMLMTKYISDKSSIIGMDISENMKRQFLEKFKNNSNIKFINQRIDKPFKLGQQFDRVFISFVIHGFPHEVRTNVIANAYNHLKPGGIFSILDFAEFDMNKMPFHHRYIFKNIECKYAFDYIEKDWKSILKNIGFNEFKESFYMKKYVRLLQAKKQDPNI